MRCHGVREGSRGIRATGGVARMADPSVILRIIEAVTIPVMAKARIGHFVEAQILEALGVDYVDESEVLTPADNLHHIDKRQFKVPFVCGARNLGEALRRVGEGAAMIRTKGEAGTGNVVEAVIHMRAILGEIRRLQLLPKEELMAAAKAAFELIHKRFPHLINCSPSMTWKATLDRSVGCPGNPAIRTSRFHRRCSKTADSYKEALKRLPPLT